MSTPTPLYGEELHQKILKLIERIEGEVSTLKNAHTTEIESLTMRCRLDMQKIHVEFSNELDSIEQKHNLQLTRLADEISYLKEMSQSQRMMMESNLEYLKELELRYENLKQVKQ